MAHFAKIENGIVTEVIVAEQDFINSGAVGDPTKWIQTSYNRTIRKNYAGIGYHYNKQLDTFISPKPFDSWVLNGKECSWEAPVEKPNDDKFYTWNETTLSWTETKNVLPGEE